MLTTLWTKEDKSISKFQSSVRSQIRALWLGEITGFDFVDTMQSVIVRGFRQAWLEGAAICGIQENELSPQERQVREQMILDQLPFLPGFASDIIENDKSSGGKLQPLFDRGFMWINRYNEVKERAQGMACADEKREWILGPTDHCRSCLGFSGRVYRLSTWDANGAWPRNDTLCCGGFRCQCRRVPTTKRITPGRFPSSLLCGG